MSVDKGDTEVDDDDNDDDSNNNIKIIIIMLREGPVTQTHFVCDTQPPVSYRHRVFICRHIIYE
jgi:hypothetical protein